MIRCLIVEDEEPAQEVLKKYMDDFPVLHLEACVNNAIDALTILQTKPVDLIFLDIHLPKLSGLNFLRAQKNPPKVIITSAYPQYAIDGYELDVLDYLLKPFSFERFIKAVSKVQPEKVSPTLIQDSQEEPAFIIIKDGKAFSKIALDDILYFQSEGDLLKIYTEQAVKLEFQSLKYYENVCPKKFIRVHKSYIVNLDRLTSISGNRLFLGEIEIPIGRSFKAFLLDRLNIQ